MLMATLLARMPDLRRRAQKMHVADDNWYCRECGGRVQWPCDVYQIATEAQQIADSSVDASNGWLPEPRRVPTRRLAATPR